MTLINEYLCGILLPIFLIFFGIFFGIKLKFFYLFHPIKTVKAILKNEKGGFRSLSVALAGTLGVGNIIGVASAILLGGAGSIFWMWVSAVCAMSLKYVEVYLAMKHRRFAKDSSYGGAPYYIKDGLKNKYGTSFAFLLSVIFAILCVINSLTTGNLVQINSVSSILPIHPLIFGIIFTVLAFLVILGGIKRITKITSVLIPFLTLAYVIMCLSIIVVNAKQIPSIFATIIKNAFNIKSALGGACGYGIAAAMRYGVSRGVLSNEAGCGTSPAAHASSASGSPHGQGCLGILEVFIDTMLLCSLTAFVVLLSPNCSLNTPVSVVINAFEHWLGSFGKYAVEVLAILFAFATVICQYFYGIESISYISKKKSFKSIFSFIFLSVLLIGSVIPMWLMWEISDLALAVMTLINLICLFLLRKQV